jgi:hypothetical protein
MNPSYHTSLTKVSAENRIRTAKRVLTSLFILTFLIPSLVLGLSLEALKWENGPTDRKFEFYYNDPNEPCMVALQEKYRLNELTSNAKNDFDRATIICDWVHKQFDHQGDCPPQPNNPITIIEKGRRGAKFSCREYAMVTAACLNSIGIKARPVQLLPKDVANLPMGSYHFVTQAFLSDRKKWVMVDAQWNVIPTLKGFPLSTVELQPALAKDFAGIEFGKVSPEVREAYKRDIGRYLYYFIVFFDNRLEGTAFPHREEGGLLLAPLGTQLPSYFASLKMSRITVTHVLSEFYGQSLK